MMRPREAPETTVGGPMALIAAHSARDHRNTRRLAAVIASDASWAPAFAGLRAARVRLSSPGVSTFYECSFCYNTRSRRAWRVSAR
jgi:hypothetical protein